MCGSSNDKHQEENDCQGFYNYYYSLTWAFFLCVCFFKCKQREEKSKLGKHPEPLSRIQTLCSSIIYFQFALPSRHIQLHCNKYHTENGGSLCFHNLFSSRDKMEVTVMSLSVLFVVPLF